MLPHHRERAYLIRAVKVQTGGSKRMYPGPLLPKAIKRYGKQLKGDRMTGSVVLTISEMTAGENSQPKETTTYAVISDTDGQLYLTLPR